jgi:hypothetical protein
MTTPDEAAAAEHPAAPLVTEQPQVSRETLLGREMAMISDQLKARDGEVKDLKSRYAQLQEQMLEIWEMNGTRYRDVDGRRVYTHTNRFPLYKEKPPEKGGGKYAAADAVAALKTIGRGAQVTPETVNWQTMRSILLELRKDEQPVPPELAEIVELGEALEIRVGAPK